MTFASLGADSQPHLAAELVFRDDGVKGVNVPFRGEAMAHTELLAGRVDAALPAITTRCPTSRPANRARSGWFPASAAGSIRRPASLREQGLRSAIGAGWYGFMAPSALPKPIVERLQREVLRALADSEVKQKLLAQGLQAHGTTAAEFAGFIEAGTPKWGALIREAGSKGQ